MSLMFCSICECKLEEEDDFTTVDGRPVCDSCFSENYHYCSNCDTVIHSNETYYNNAGDPFCSSCYEDEDNEDDDEFDEDCPNNPSVTEEEKETIIKLANQWLNDDNPRKFNINIKQGDYCLADLRTKIGLVISPVYVYGLSKRDEYELCVSPDLQSHVTDFVDFNNFPWQVTTGNGSRRIGISYSLRQDHFDEIIKLVKELTDGVLCAV